MEKKLPPQIISSTLEQGLTIAEEIKIAKRLLQKEGFKIKKSSSDEEEVSYRSFDEEASKEKQKLAQKLKSRGFRGEVISKLLFY